MSIEINSIVNEAQKEHKEDLAKEAKAKLKKKYSELEKANLMVKNIQREIDDMIAQIAHELK